MRLRHGDLETVEVAGGQRTHCHVQKNSWRLSEVCDMVDHPAGSSHEKMVHCSHDGMDMVSSYAQIGCKTCSVGIKDIPPHH